MESTYKAVVTDLKTPSLKENHLEPLQEGEVRIKVHAAPVNPSDYYFAVGLYGDRTLFKSQTEMGMGFEGAGEIVEVGAGVDASNIGKVVAFLENCHSHSYTGTWR